MTNTNTMKDTIRPFALGSNVLVEIVSGVIRQINNETKELIKEIPVSALNQQQIEAIERARESATAAMIAQGFFPAGTVNSK